MEQSLRKTGLAIQTRQISGNSSCRGLLQLPGFTPGKGINEMTTRLTLCIVRYSIGRVACTLPLSAVALMVLNGCASLEAYMEAERTGVKHATVPVVLFDANPGDIERLLADWCSSPRKPDGPLLGAVNLSMTGRESGVVTCQTERDFSVTHSGRLDSQMLGNVNEVRRKTGSEPIPLGSIHFDVVREWFKFTLEPVDGATCVRVFSEVQRTDSERMPGAYTDFATVLVELGGTVSPVETSRCQ